MSLSTIEQLHDFHAQDRAIFIKLVLKFLRSPAESLLIMAIWLWLEDFGFGDIFSIINAFNDQFIADLAGEAVRCLRCLESSEPPHNINWIPLTTRYMTRDISLQIIYEHRYSAITGIKNFLTTICSKIFSDILQQVLPASPPSHFPTFPRPLNIPGFPHPTFGDIIVMPYVIARENLHNNNIPSGLWGWNANCIATENDRTLFLTFSRGFPVSEAEVKERFTKEFGDDCVRGVYMQGNNGSSLNHNMEQSLFARLVVDSVATVDDILKGTKDPRKFRINGKHIWARKYGEKPRQRDVST